MNAAPGLLNLLSYFDHKTFIIWGVQETNEIQNYVGHYKSKQETLSSLDLIRFILINFPYILLAFVNCLICRLINSDAYATLYHNISASLCISSLKKSMILIVCPQELYFLIWEILMNILSVSEIELLSYTLFSLAS